MSFSLLASTFANNLLPILLLSGAGFTLGKIFPIDSRSLGRVIFYIFAPMLVFELLVQNEIDITEAVKVVSFTAVYIFMMLGITLGFGLAFKLDRPTLAAVMIATVFGNTGNYGLPLVSFAFGGDALKYAGLFFVTTAILHNTGGVLIASLGHMNFKQAFLGMFKVPVVYSLVFAVLFRTLPVEMPMALSRTIELAAGGSIPMMIVLLGVELSRVQWTEKLRGVSLSVSLRLLAGPVVGFFLSLLFGLSGAAQQAAVIQSSMPAAVNTTILATEYKLDSSLVTAIVYLGTVLSPLTLTPLIVLLGR